jgi:hypothetical protein
MLSESGTISPCAEDSHSVAVEMHNTFVENAVSTERTLLKAVSMARFMLELQLCISTAYNKPCASKRRESHSGSERLWFESSSGTLRAVQCCLQGKPPRGRDCPEWAYRDVDKFSFASSSNLFPKTKERSPGSPLFRVIETTRGRSVAFVESKVMV